MLRFQHFFRKIVKLSQKSLSRYHECDLNSKIDFNLVCFYLLQSEEDKQLQEELNMLVERLKVWVLMLVY